jgi:elongation factor Tu
MSEDVVRYYMFLGHADHGKTTLTAALGNEYVSRSEDKRNKPISVDQIEEADFKTTTSKGDEVTYYMSQPYTINDIRYILWDCPTDNVSGVVSTIGPGFAGAILVVAAPDGPMPGTREHIKLARDYEVPIKVVFLNKIDMMDDEELVDLVELDIKDLLEEYFDNKEVEKIQIVRGSALKAYERQSDNPDYYESISELASKTIG